MVASAPSRENNSSAVLTAAPLEQSTSTFMPVSFSGDIYNHMWGRAEFTASGTLKDYDGRALLARLDGLEAHLVQRAQESDNSTAAYVGQLEQQVHQINR